MSLRSTAILVVLSAGASALIEPRDVYAQGITTAAIRGTVRGAGGTEVDGTRVTVIHTATGAVVHAEVREGRFLVQGLEVGGPYLVQLRRIGFHPQQRERLFLGLGESLALDVTLQPAALPLDSLEVTATALQGVNASGGTATTVTDSLLHRLPTLNRNLYDFVRLAPQVSTRISFAPGGMSAGGAGFRLNNFLVNGVPQRSVGGQVPPEFSGERSVPLDAVSEYQVLVAPFDVRYGDFAGALVNAVTRMGTNAVGGSVFVTDFEMTDPLPQWLPCRFTRSSSHGNPRFIGQRYPERTRPGDPAVPASRLRQPQRTGGTPCQATTGAWDWRQRHSC